MSDDAADLEAEGEAAVPFAGFDPGDPVLARLTAAWWYYTVELAPGVFARGQYQPTRPMPPRTLMRGVDLRGATCLDMGSMEGLMPVLMSRGGATQVIATDYNQHCLEKMAAVRLAYGVDFQFAAVGPMHDLFRKLTVNSFDLINCSGLLYHVWSPLHVLASVRPLLRRNGLMIASTYTVDCPELVAEFNQAGGLDAETNTFWYLSLPLFDYLLAYMRLIPIDLVYMPLNLHGRHGRSDCGYVSVLCRASDVADDDAWMIASHAQSWEFMSFCDWAMADAQTASTISMRDGRERGRINVAGAVHDREWPLAVNDPADAHVLRLSDQT
ncbi:MAG TPA: methyltransferase domain-containing protein [Acidimicrobiales bacterium]|nr:methyltransferase domain-containing protein [Acidimicrobiales bacterium]